MSDKDAVKEEAVKPVEVKAVPKEQAEHPAWFKELVAGTRVVTEQEEPEAVTRMRNV